MTGSSNQLSAVQLVKDVNVLAMEVPDANADTLRILADKFREKHCPAVLLREDRFPQHIPRLSVDAVRREHVAEVSAARSSHTFEKVGAEHDTHTSLRKAAPKVELLPPWWSSWFPFSRCSA